MRARPSLGALLRARRGQVSPRLPRAAIVAGGRRAVTWQARIESRAGQPRCNDRIERCAIRRRARSAHRSTRERAGPRRLPHRRRRSGSPGPLHQPGVRRPRARPALVTGVAGRVPRGGDRRGRRLLRIPDRRPVDPRRPVGTRTRSGPTTTRACTGGPVSARAAGTSTTTASGVATTPGATTSTASLVEVVDAEEFAPIPEGVCLGEVRVDRWGGFVWVCLDPGAPPLLEYLDPLPALLAPYHLDRLRLRTYLSTVLPANWKVVVDAFNEGYHVQGTHPQLLPWTDDVNLDYEPLGIHAHYGRLPDARRTRCVRAPASGWRRASTTKARSSRIFVRRPRGPLLRRRACPGRRDPRPALRRCDHVEPLPEGPARAARGPGRRRRARSPTTSSPVPTTCTSSPTWSGRSIRAPPSSSGCGRTGSTPTAASRTPGSSNGPTRRSRRSGSSDGSTPTGRSATGAMITNQDYANMEHVQIGMKSRGGAELPAEPPPGGQHPAHAPDDRPLPDRLKRPGPKRRAVGSLRGSGTARRRRAPARR